MDLSKAIKCIFVVLYLISNLFYEADLILDTEPQEDVMMLKFILSIEKLK